MYYKLMGLTIGIFLGILLTGCGTVETAPVLPEPTPWELPHDLTPNGAY